MRKISAFYIDIFILTAINFYISIKYSMLTEKFNLTSFVNLGTLSYLLTIIIDVINVKFSPFIQKQFLKLFNTQKINKVYIYLFVYLLFIGLLFSIYLLGNSQSNANTNNKLTTWNEIIDFIILLPLFGYGVILLLQPLKLLAPNRETEGFVGKHKLFFATLFVVLYIIMVSIPFAEIEPVFYFGSINYLFLYIPVLIITDLFINYSIVLWKTEFVGEKKQREEKDKSIYLEFFLAFIIYFLFFGAPRLLLLQNSFHITTLLSAVFSLMYFVWKSLGGRRL